VRQLRGAERLAGNRRRAAGRLGRRLAHQHRARRGAEPGRADGCAGARSLVTCSCSKKPAPSGRSKSRSR
jgi:hypothetical protein